MGAGQYLSDGKRNIRKGRGNGRRDAHRLCSAGAAIYLRRLARLRLIAALGSETAELELRRTGEGGQGTLARELVIDRDYWSEMTPVVPASSRSQPHPTRAPFTPANPPPRYSALTSTCWPNTPNPIRSAPSIATTGT
jgi:hypothetical protein